ncbi:hypothetical protein ALI22I_09550 [Saccharothrix sp. ALI-22-I]|uniref:hypothetical protein n=1 Tax=Saccharothrix sp. ALI-22-I TaxID=1933778 RepID=UPI0009D09299|nr:hypothetical protein [Saccharothrix sp. ALI-22-I]ONI91295.1 hypothetical protein ALI22I_09550 [Saccharothrix sp. ALI-22-I]
MSERVVLVLDYPGRRAESRVADLPLESFGFDVRHLLDEPFVRAVDTAGYAAELAARHGPFGPEVVAVLAYCMAAPIAQEVAALCGAIPLVLFDGEPSTPAGIADQYEVSVTQVREQLGLPAVDRGLPFEDGLLSERPGECLESMRRAFVELAVSALRADSADEDAEVVAAQVADFYLDWLSHLVAAHNASWPAWGGEVLHIASRRHSFTEDWPGARRTTVHRVDTERNDLLRHPHTLELVRSFLAEAGTGDGARFDRNEARA